MIGNLVGTKYSGTNPFSAEKLPVGGGGLMSSSFDYSLTNLRSDSALVSQRRAMDQHIVQLESALQAADPEFDVDTLYKGAPKYFSLEESEDLNGFARNSEEARYAAIQSKLRTLGRDDLLIPWEQIQGSAAEIANMSKAKFEEDSIYNYAQSPRMRAFAGMAGANITDPVILTSVAMSLPMTLTRGVAKTALAEGAIGALEEIPIQAQVQAWHHERGQEYTSQDVSKNIFLGGVLAGGFGGVMSTIYRLAGGTSKTLFNGPGVDADRMRMIDHHKRQALRAKSVARHKRLYPEPEVEETLAVPIDTEFGYAIPRSDEQQYQSFVDFNEFAAGLTKSSEVRIEALMQASDEHLRLSNPIAQVPKEGTATVDTFNYVFSAPDSNAMHTINLQQSIQQFNRGELIAPKYKATLSLETFVADTNPQHVTWQRQISRDGKFKPDSSEYRTNLAGFIANNIQPTVMRRLADTPDGLTKAGKTPKIKPSARKPRTAEPTVVSRMHKKGAEVDELRGTLKKTTAEYNKAKAAAQRRGAGARASKAKTPDAKVLVLEGENQWKFPFLDEEFSLYKVGNKKWQVANSAGEFTEHSTRAAAMDASRFLTHKYLKAYRKGTSANKAALAKLDKDYDKASKRLNKQITDAEDAIQSDNALMRQYEAYHTDVLRTERFNRQIDLANDYMDLQAGKIPARFRPLARRMTKQFEKTRGEQARRTEVVRSPGMRRVDQFNLGRTEFDIDPYVNGDNFARYVDRLNDDQVADARRAEFEAMNDEIRIQIDGEDLSMADLKQRIKDDEIIAANLKGCAL